MDLAPLVADHQDVLVGLQKPLLKWLAAQRSMGLVKEEDVSSWKQYFSTLGHTIMYIVPFFAVCVYIIVYTNGFLSYVRR